MHSVLDQALPSEYVVISRIELPYVTQWNLYFFDSWFVAVVLLRDVFLRDIVVVAACYKWVELLESKFWVSYLVFVDKAKYFASQSLQDLLIMFSLVEQILHCYISLFVRELSLKWIFWVATWRHHTTPAAHIVWSLIFVATRTLQRDPPQFRITYPLDKPLSLIFGNYKLTLELITA